MVAIRGGPERTPAPDERRVENGYDDPPIVQGG
jgi:hypothetical protein